jgi:hypothetical protein
MQNYPAKFLARAGFTVEKCFFLEGTAKTSPSEFMRAFI